MRSAALLSGVLLLTSCATTRQIVASDGSHRWMANDLDSGVTIVLTSDVWAGDPGYADDFTIVHVLIANMGSESVLLAPGDFELSDRQGFDYRLHDAGGSFTAIPPNQDPSAAVEVGYDPGRALDFEGVATDDGELSELALPWGVLLPGTQMRGYLYFDDVRDTANHATLIWHAQTPDHRVVADFGFEFHVSETSPRSRPRP